MATPKVLLKRSSVAGKVPTTSDLDHGELAINFQDGKIYYKDASNNIKAFVDSARVEAIAAAVEVVALAQLDSGEVTNLIDSSYVQVRVPESYLSTIIDSAYVAARQTAQNFAYGALTGAPTIPTLGTDFVDSAQVVTIIDSSYIQARQADIFRDSAFVTGIVDTAYIQARDRIRDSNFVSDIVDSNYVRNRQIQYNTSNFTDSAFVTSQIAAINIGTDSAAVSSIITADVTKSFVDALGVNADTLDGQEGVHYLQYSNLTGRPVVLDSAMVYRFTIDSARVLPLIASTISDSTSSVTVQINNTVTAQVDSAYVLARVALAPFLDSTDAINLIDSSYVQARQTAVGITVQEEGSALSTAGTTLNFVGSNVTATGSGATKTITITGGGTIDSSQVVSIVDSSYVQARQIVSQQFDFGTITTPSRFTLDMGSI